MLHDFKGMQLRLESHQYTQELLRKELMYVHQIRDIRPTEIIIDRRRTVREIWRFSFQSGLNQRIRL
jgi:hypothetical protein